MANFYNFLIMISGACDGQIIVVTGKWPYAKLKKGVGCKQWLTNILNKINEDMNLHKNIPLIQNGKKEGIEYSLGGSALKRGLGGKAPQLGNLKDGLGAKLS